MKKLILFCIAACCTATLSAQKVYYLYLQTDDLSPFYVRMSEKIFSSAVAGYLILPNLTDSTYTLNIGFAKSTKPETRFAVTVNQNDKGYLIKNFEDGLSLFDLQNLSLVKPFSAIKDNTVYETKTDKFSSLLSKAADDPSLLKVPVKKEEPVVIKTEEKKEPEKTEIKPSQESVISQIDTTKKNAVVQEDEMVKVDSIASIQQGTQPEEVKQDHNLLELTDYKPSVVTRRSESSTTEGFGVVYYDAYEGAVDTIRILIPPSKFKIEEPEITGETEKKADTIALITPNELMLQKDNAENAEKVAAISFNCKGTASDKDFLKLRKNMASKDNDEAMIAEARKIFKNKCFSVEQVRYLSTLFLTSAGKYQFFDAAFNYVTEKKDFTTLQSEIRDEYYLKRFKALIGE